MQKIKVKRTGLKRINIHNDLSAACRHIKQRIEEELERRDRAGLAYDCMACMTMLAFAVEAYINFVGKKVVDDWEERAPFHKKRKAILKQLDREWDMAKRPYSSINRLKTFRDLVAHGKPIEIPIEETLEGTPDELDEPLNYDGEWAKYCTPEVVFYVYDDVEEIWKELLEHSGIPFYETITSGQRTTKYLGGV